MSKEQCKAVTQLLRQALSTLKSGSCGQGKGVSMAITHCEDAYLRINPFHMGEMGWLDDSIPTPAATTPRNILQAVPPPAMVRNIPRSTLRPAPADLRLSTGLMNTTPQPTVLLTPNTAIESLNSSPPPPRAPMRRPIADMLDDLSMIKG